MKTLIFEFFNSHTEKFCRAVLIFALLNERDQGGVIFNPKLHLIPLDDVSPCPLRASDSAREREKGEKERRGRRGDYRGVTGEVIRVR